MSSKWLLEEIAKELDDSILRIFLDSVLMR